MLDLKRPHPYQKRGDQIVPLTQQNYLTLFYGIPRYAPDGTSLILKGRVMYTTERLYVGNGAVHIDEKTIVPYAEIAERFPWFWDEYSKISPELRREVGVALPSEQAKNADELSDQFLSTWENLPEHIREQLQAKYAAPTEQHEPVDMKKMWKCDECGEDVEAKSKGLHIGRHAKSRKHDNE